MWVLVICGFAFLFEAIWAFKLRKLISIKDNALADYTTKLKVSESSNADLQRQLNEREKIINDIRVNLDDSRKVSAIAETRLEEANKNIEEQKRLLQEAENKLTSTFQALSGEALKSNNQAFIDLAKKSLEAVLNEAKGELGKKEMAIKGCVEPLTELLQRYEHQINELEKTRASAYGSLESNIKSLVSMQQQLEKETNNLVTALRRPDVRGRWGEITLKRVVELSGMTMHCDYTEQVSVSTDDVRLRPDMVIHLPADREIVVDSKVPLDAYLDAVAAKTEEDKKSFITKHAQQIRKHMKSLASKSYWGQFPKAPEFVVMFIPGESFLSSALDADYALIDDGMKDGVIMATPTTLVALLKAVAYGWRQEQIAQHAKEIAALGKEIYERFQPFLEHVNKVGGNLDQAVGSFNKMINSLDSRVMVSVRKFKELGVAGDSDLPELKQVAQLPVKRESSDSVE